MSKSPRRLLRRAADALNDLQRVIVEHPDAAAELTRTLGVAENARLMSAIEVVQRSAAQLEGGPRELGAD